MEKDPTKKNKRTASQKEADAAFIEHYAVMGKTVRQMKDMLNVERAKATPPYTLSHSQVDNDLKKIRAAWRKEAFQEISDYVKAEMKGLQRQEDELWEAWAKSKLDATTKTAETSGSDSKRGSKSKITVEGRTGEATYMNLILQIREQRRSLLGLDQPKRTEITGADGGAIIVAQAQFDPAAVRGPAPEKKPDAPNAPHKPCGTDDTRI